MKTPITMKKGNLHYYNIQNKERAFVVYKETRLKTFF